MIKNGAEINQNTLFTQRSIKSAKSWLKSTENKCWTKQIDYLQITQN